MKKNIKLLLCVAVFLTLLFTMDGQAEAMSVMKAGAIETYPVNNSRIQIYSDEKLETESSDVSYRKFTIGKLNEQTKAVSVSYKKGSLVKTGWAKASDFFVDNRFNSTLMAYANQNVTLLRNYWSNKKSAVIESHKGGLVVGAKGGYYQLLFFDGRTSYMGWVSGTTYSNYVRASRETTTQYLANGTYALIPVNATTKAVQYSTKGNSLSVKKKNLSSSAQRFVLKYQNQGQYFSIKTKSKGSNILGEEQWKLMRTGGNFYLVGCKSNKALTYSGSKIKRTKYGKKSTQKWRIVKITPANGKKATVYSQYDPKWGDYTYCNGPLRRTISTSGCGVVALTNAIHALNGYFISPKTVATFSNANGHYYYNQGTADSLFAAAAKKYGSKYHFKHMGKTYSMSTVRKYLNKGGTVVALVPGHYIAIVDYDKKTKKYHVLDSAIYNKRPTTVDGDWVSESDLRSGYLYCEYFHIFMER